MATYTVDHAPAMPHCTALQQPSSGLPRWEGIADIPAFDSSSSSEPSHGLPLAATPASILPEPPLLRLGSRGFGQEVPTAAGSRQTSSSAADDNLIYELQKLSLLSADTSDRASRAAMNMPPMPADVWRGVMIPPEDSKGTEEGAQQELLPPATLSGGMP